MVANLHDGSDEAQVDESECLFCCSPVSEFYQLLDSGCDFLLYGVEV